MSDGQPAYDCPFCQRIQAEWPNGQFVVWFEPLNPVTPGHLLFVPRTHVRDATEDPFITAAVTETAAWTARERGGDYNLITSIGDAATQTVHHLHVHLVPRRPGDGLTLPWTGQEVRHVS